MKPFLPLISLLLLITSDLSADNSVRNMNRWRGYAPFADMAGRVQGFHALPLQGSNAELTAIFESHKPGDALLYLADREGRRISFGQGLTEVADAFGDEHGKPTALILPEGCSPQPATITSGKPATNPRRIQLRLRIDSDSLLFISHTAAGAIETVMPLPFRPDSIGIGAAGRPDLIEGRLSLTINACPAIINTDTLDSHFQRSSDPMEGYWIVLDRDLDEKRIRLGGDYTLAIVRDDNGGYSLIYIEGARVCAPQWQRGDLKGRLKAGGIKGVYDCEWLDSKRSSISHDVTAQQDPADSRIITVQFPYQRSSLRLRKLK